MGHLFGRMVGINLNSSQIEQRRNGQRASGSTAIIVSCLVSAEYIIVKIVKSVQDGIAKEEGEVEEKEEDIAALSVPIVSRIDASTVFR